MDSPTPVSSPNRSDPGDETAKKFRYQYAYGVILWVAAFRSERDYTALWCEQHEDFLGQVSENLFDAFQLKTRKPETGPWEWNDDALAGSVERFVNLDRLFPDQIRHFYFISNAECSQSAAKDRMHLAPVTVLDHLTSPCGPYLECCERCLEALAQKTGCSREQLLPVLQRMRICQGPAENGFDAEIAHSHLSAMDGCASLVPRQLNDLLDALVSRIYLASSRGSRDAARHYAIVNGAFADDPQLCAKRIEIESLKTLIDEAKLPHFRYLTKFKTIQLEPERKETSVLKQKLIVGRLEDYYDSIQRQTLSAERRLIELQSREPDRAGEIHAQIESVVLEVCRDAHLHTAHEKKPFGRPMLKRVKADLKTLAEQKPDHVYREPFETLVGFTGLLTEDCQVWWSKKFTPEGKA